LAALAAAAAVLAGLNTVNQGAATTPVVVAVHPIAGGAELNAADLAVVWWPQDIVPEGAFAQVDDAAGQTSIAAIPVRAAVTAADVLEGGSLVGAGLVALPVSFSGSTSVLNVGDHIDILGPEATTGQNKVLAADVRIAAMPHSQTTFGSGTDLVLVEVTPTTAAQLSASAGITGLTFALR
jgi:Flp pilus assembly protein CpaB